MKRKALGILLVLVLTIQLCTVAAMADTLKFTDVNSDDYYFRPVIWATDNGITAGVSDTQFGPGEICTRAQIVTFLYKSFGSPFVLTTNEFSDVPSSEYYAKAVSWAVSKGITSGTGDGKFSPNDPCTRGQAVTFIWRAEGSPTENIGGTMDYRDLTEDYYVTPIRWAMTHWVASGTGKFYFGANDPCTRGQIMTFLWRDRAIGTEGQWYCEDVADTYAHINREKQNAQKNGSEYDDSFETMFWRYASYHVCEGEHVFSKDGIPADEIMYLGYAYFDDFDGNIPSYSTFNSLGTGYTISSANGKYYFTETSEHNPKDQILKITENWDGSLTVTGIASNPSSREFSRWTERMVDNENKNPATSSFRIIPPDYVVKSASIE